MLPVTGYRLTAEPGKRFINQHFGFPFLVSPPFLVTLAKEPPFPPLLCLNKPENSEMV